MKKIKTAAANSKTRITGISLCLSISLIIFSCNDSDHDVEKPDPNVLTDVRDNTVYQIIKIGNQTWMAENLRYLPSVVGPGTGSSNTPYYYVYGYNGTSTSEAKATENYSTFGVLYNWPATMNGQGSSALNPSNVQGVCPAGWHVPSIEEWTELYNYLGGQTVAGGKLKALTHWNMYNGSIVASGEAGFEALPGGRRHYSGSFDRLGETGLWWTTLEYDAGRTWFCSIDYSSLDIYKSADQKENGHCVRCVKD